MPKTVPPRLHAILARDANTGVLIRRGPSNRVAVIGWNRDDDSFQMGQWLRGRIYERRCDLSPDGQHFLYFAMNGKWSSEVLGAWTAVSKAPYLKALGLWPKGNCWNGGGLFIDNQRFWLNDGRYAHRTTQEAPGLSHQRDCPWPGAHSGECPGVYYARLIRDGWAHQSEQPDGAGGHITHFSKRVNDHWSLHKYAHETAYSPVGRSCYFDEHALYNEKTEALVTHPDWEWAEVDGARMLWATAGKLFSGRLERTGMTRMRPLFDSTTLSPAHLEAPY